MSVMLIVLHWLCHFCCAGFAVSRIPPRIQCDDKDDVANVTWGWRSVNLGNTLCCLCEQIEDSLFVLYKSKYENQSLTWRVSLQSCRVHLFCSSLYVGHLYWTRDAAEWQLCEMVFLPCNLRLHISSNLHCYWLESYLHRMSVSAMNWPFLQTSVSNVNVPTVCTNTSLIS